MWTNSCKLAAKGTYHLNAAIKCYAGRTLVETISESSADVKY